jgi:hypothetical protein
MGLKWKVAEWSGLSMNHHHVAQATFCTHFQKWKKVALWSGLRTYPHWQLWLSNNPRLHSMLAFTYVTNSDPTNRVQLIQGWAKYEQLLIVFVHLATLLAAPTIVFKVAYYSNLHQKCLWHLLAPILGSNLNRWPPPGNVPRAQAHLLSVITRDSKVRFMAT